MSEPAWKLPPAESDEPESGVVLLQRWVERPDGRLELLEMPLTPEDFLNPQPEDRWMQGQAHANLRRHLASLLEHRFRNEPDTVILEDMKHLLGPGLPGPAPDVSVVRGLRILARDRESFDVIEEGVLPCLVVEILSPSDARIRRTDEVDKVALYERVGIPEYLLVDVPRRLGSRPLRLRGRRLDATGRYRMVDLDGSSFASEATGLRFAVSPEGDRIEIFDTHTGQRLLTLDESEDARRAAEDARKAAEDARKAVEDELARLRAELAALKRT